MHARLFVVSVLVSVFTAAASAQDTAPPPVDTMTCEQMQTELVGAGQSMNSQLDPEFAREAQAMHAEAQSRQPQSGDHADQVAQNHARMQAQADRLNASMAGLDQQRLMALADRFEQQGCETPQ